MNKRLFIRRLLFIVSVLILTCLTCMPAWASKKIGKTIAFSDSYGTRPFDGTKWTGYVKEYFGLNQHTMTKKIKGGSGFAVKSKEKNFLYKLKKMKADPDVRTILIVGGINNDMPFSESTVRKKMKEFNKYALKKFPRATIYYALPNWTAQDQPTKDRILKRKEFCKREAHALKWKWMPSTEKCLYGQKNWYQKDLHHPNKNGAMIIGRAIIKDLKSFKIKRN